MNLTGPTRVKKSVCKIDATTVVSSSQYLGATFDLKKWVTDATHVVTIMSGS